MSTTNAALELLNSTLETLEASLNGRTSEINSQYNEAKKLADKSHKDALALAEKSKIEALAEFQSEKDEIAKLKNAIKALTGESPKSKSPKADKNGIVKTIEIPKSFEDASSNNQKIAFIISQLGSATNNDIIAKLKEYGIEIKSNIGDLTGKLESSGLLISERVAGKKVYSLA